MEPFKSAFTDDILIDETSEYSKMCSEIKNNIHFIMNNKLDKKEIAKILEYVEKCKVRLIQISFMSNTGKLKIICPPFGLDVEEIIKNIYGIKSEP